MSNNIQLKKGLNIPISGAADQSIRKVIVPDVVAVKPTDFRALKAKLAVKEGDRVLAGSPVLINKECADIVFTSPVSGTVAEVVRGEKRKLLEVRIKADQAVEYVDFGKQDVKALDAEAVKALLMKSGLWACLIERPYGVVANPAAAPKAIFVSAFSTAPLAAEVEFALAGELANIQAAVCALGKIAPVHMSFASEQSAFYGVEGATKHVFTGAHPAGNVGVQIHHVCPIQKGETVWTVTMHELAIIGRLLNTGKYDATRTIAVTGPKAIKPAYVKAVAGISISALKEFFDASEGLRYVSGDCLTGKNVGAEGFLSFHDNQVTILKEGNEYEAFGWAKPFRFKQFSSSHTYFHWILGWLSPKQYDLDTNLHGGERAFVVSDVYGKVFPMNLFPIYLTKACIAKDIDKMEKFGIYEVLEEDLALCEYVCPSKINIQQYIAEGIELMIKEMA
ncbi:MAG: Na(+)-translocating NADH-quinone reductase subunit A [Bacteroidales bacterium]|nr:Na(+)-translocating NADH-quinone reductase subunit A [Bacteroidales bacterium]